MIAHLAIFDILVDKYPLIQAIIARNILQALNPKVGNLDSVRHQVGLNEHFVVPTCLIMHYGIFEAIVTIIPKISDHLRRDKSPFLFRVNRHCSDDCEVH